MDIFLPALSLLSAAFCVWLGVRIVNRRERWAKWTAAGTVVLPALYVLSFGPACWISSRTETDVPMDDDVESSFVAAAYQPVLSIAWRGPKPIRDSVRWYAHLLANESWGFAYGHGGCHWGHFVPMCMNMQGRNLEQFLDTETESDVETCIVIPEIPLSSE
jgi:hypothetical protein